jgi:hypothetical protein
MRSNSGGCFGIERMRPELIRSALKVATDFLPVVYVLAVPAGAALFA